MADRSFGANGSSPPGSEEGAALEHAEWINVIDAFPNFAFAD